METTPGIEELTPENLAKHIAKLRADMDTKFLDLQNQLDSLGDRSDSNDEKQNTQIAETAIRVMRRAFFFVM